MPSSTVAEIAPPERLDLLLRVGQAGIGFLHRGTEVGEDPGGARGRRFDLRIELGAMAEPRAPGDAQAGDAVVEPDAEIRRRRVPRRHVAGVRLRDHREHQGGVADRAGQRSVVGEHAERRGRIGRHAPEARLDAEHAGEGGRDADRARSVGAEVELAEVEQRRRRGPAGRAAGGAVELPRIAGDAGERAVTGPDPAELGQGGLAENDRALLAQAGDRGRIGGAGRRIAGARAAPGRPALGPDVVLDGRRHPVDEAEGRALAPARFRRGGSRERAGVIDQQERVDDRIEALDARERVAHHLDRRKFAAAIAPEQLAGGQRMDVGHRLRPGTRKQAAPRSVPPRARPFRPGAGRERLAGGALDEIDDGLAQVRIGNRRVGTQQPVRVGLRHGGERRLQALPRHLIDLFAPVEERADRHVEDARDPGQAAGPHPVGALLVFLHLLKRHADALGQLALRQAGGEALDADALPDLDVDQVRFF
jgi:hypothetical protein